MKKDQKSTRRKFFRDASMIGLGSVLAPGIGSLRAAPVSKSASVTEGPSIAAATGRFGSKAKYEIGVASWALRGLDFEGLIQGMKDLQIKHCSLKSMHLPLDLPPSELKGRIQKMRNAGLNPYAPGVVYMKTEQEVKDSFKYTKDAGLNMIVGVPNYELLDMVEDYVKKTGIRMAIHNHGPDGQPYPSPEDAYNRVKNRDKGIGLCVDVSHTTRNGLDPAQQLRLVADRLMDVHIWDVSEAAKAGKAIRPGKGVLDFEGVLGTLIDIGYEGTIAIEYGGEMENPIPAFAETKGYINGVLSQL